MNICPDCVTGTVLPGTATGTMIKIGKIDVYYAKAPSTRAEGADKKAIILFTDLFGLPFNNPKILSDAFAKELGLDVYSPDSFNGSQPITEADLTPYDVFETGVKAAWWQNLGFVWILIKAIPSILLWNTPAKVVARMKTFVEDLKREKGLDRVGAVGYCYGGLVIVNLAPFNLLSTAVVCHPGSIHTDTVKKINFPVSWVTCEEDFAFSPEQAVDCEALFAARTGDDKVEYEFRKYMGTKHGFAARPALHVPVIKQAFEGAFAQAVAWFKTTL